MGTFDEMKEVPKRLFSYRNMLIDLFRECNINSVPKLIKAFQTDSNFKEKWRMIWLNVAKEEGGKLSLTTIGILIGSALGGVGIAAMGTAFGLPLALLLGLGGLVSGSKFDSLKLFGKKKQITINLDKALIDKLGTLSGSLEISIDNLIEQIITESLNSSD